MQNRSTSFWQQNKTIIKGIAAFVGGGILAGIGVALTATGVLAGFGIPATAAGIAIVGSSCFVAGAVLTGATIHTADKLRSQHDGYVPINQPVIPTYEEQSAAREKQENAVLAQRRDNIKNQSGALGKKIDNRLKQLYNATNKYKYNALVKAIKYSEAKLSGVAGFSEITNFGDLPSQIKAHEEIEALFKEALSQSEHQILGINAEYKTYSWQIQDIEKRLAEIESNILNLETDFDTKQKKINDLLDTKRNQYKELLQKWINEQIGSVINRLKEAEEYVEKKHIIHTRAYPAADIALLEQYMPFLKKNSAYLPQSADNSYNYQSVYDMLNNIKKNWWRYEVTQSDIKKLTLFKPVASSDATYTPAPVTKDWLQIATRQQQQLSASRSPIFSPELIKAVNNAIKEYKNDMKELSCLPAEFRTYSDDRLESLIIKLNGSYDDAAEFRFLSLASNEDDLMAFCLRDEILTEEITDVSFFWTLKYIFLLPFNFRYKSNRSYSAIEERLASFAIDIEQVTDETQYFAAIIMLAGVIVGHLKQFEEKVTGNYEPQELDEIRRVIANFRQMARVFHRMLNMMASGIEKFYLDNGSKTLDFYETGYFNTLSSLLKLNLDDLALRLDDKEGTAVSILCNVTSSLSFVTQQLCYLKSTLGLDYLFKHFKLDNDEPSASNSPGGDDKGAAAAAACMELVYAYNNTRSATAPTLKTDTLLDFVRSFCNYLEHTIGNTIYSLYENVQKALTPKVHVAEQEVATEEVKETEKQFVMSSW